MEHSITAMDRCDRCRAPALAKTLHENGPLLWCRHHFKVHETLLTPFLVLLLQITPDVVSQEPAKH